MPLIEGVTNIPEVKGNIKMDGIDIREVIFKDSPSAAGQVVWFYNNPPSTPVITLTPTPVDGLLPPGTPVKVQVSSTDPDGDTITWTIIDEVTSATLVNGNTYSFTNGKHLIKATATDSYGATATNAVVFFMSSGTDGNTGVLGGNGVETTLTENGSTGLYVTSFTFNVSPAATNHGGGSSDYFRVEGQQPGSSIWENIVPQQNSTSNGGGCQLTGNIVTGVLSGVRGGLNGGWTPIANTNMNNIGVKFEKLRFVYYANCCIGASSMITYTVQFGVI